MLILRQSDILTLLHSLTASQALHLQDSLFQTLSEHSSLPESIRNAQQPPRSHLSSTRGTTLFMPASIPNGSGVKTVTLPATGGPAIGTLTISSSSGEPMGLLNAEEVTAFRTALVALLLFVRYPWKARGTIVIFGAGKIVEWHLRLILLLAPEKVLSITLINRSLAGLERLADVIKTLQNEHPEVDVEVIAKDQEDEYESIVAEVLGESDAVFCCTPSIEPLFAHSCLEPEKLRYISLIGSYKPHMQEVTKETLLSGDALCVDSRGACLEEAGELIMAGVGGGQLVELGEIANRMDLVNLGEKGLVFKCVGMGIMDVVVGRELLGIARERGLGINVDNF